MRRLRKADRTSTTAPNARKVANRVATSTPCRRVSRESGSVKFTVGVLASLVFRALRQEKEDRLRCRAAWRPFFPVIECIRLRGSIGPLFFQQVQRPAF